MAYAFVNEAGNDNAASASTIAVTLSCTAGNLIVIAVTGDSADSSTITSVTDGGAGNTISAISTQITSTNSQVNGAWYAKNCVGGSITFTANFPNTTRFRGIYVAQYSGLDTGSPFLNGARAESSNPGTGANAISSGNANATSQPAMVWGICIDTSGNTQPSAGTGFTQRSTTAGSSWSTNTCLNRAEDKRITSTGNVASTFTATTGTDDHVSFVGIFAEAAGPVAVSVAWLTA